MLTEDSMSEKILVHKMSHADKGENEALFENALKTRFAGDFVFRPSRRNARKLVNDHESEQNHQEAIASAEESAYETDSSADSFIVYLAPSHAVDVNENAESLADSLSHIDNALVNVILSANALA